MSRIVTPDNFSKENWISFLDTHSNYFDEDTSLKQQLKDDTFSDVAKLGSLDLPDGNAVIAYLVKTSRPLTERSYRKKQFDKAVEILKLENPQAGLFVFYDSDNSFRFSLIYPIYKGIKKEFSNFKRYTFYLKKGAPIHTYTQQIAFADFDSLNSIKDAFALEPVTKEFYTFIAQQFSKLVGGERKIGTKIQPFIQQITYPENNRDKMREFSVRLIGRLIFCWFLKKKISGSGRPLIPDNILSIKAVRNKPLFSYYHSVLEPLFFEVLNKPMPDRLEKYKLTPWDTIPFLNGGLFDNDDKDYYSINATSNSDYLNTLKIPDNWFLELFEGFDRFNFTVDESSSNDIEISIDPEMLGRVFENLLAEINPETGETARKSTGSYYTPRPVVEYMVDESLSLYLYDKTNLPKDIVDVIVTNSVDNSDISVQYKKEILGALDSIRILDPACGSGAFLMGLMHRMLFIIKKIDPELEFWKQKLIASIKDTIFKDHILKQLKYKNFEYIIKLGLIRNSIFGVDIQPIAVEISKLRLFLSLIVDELIDDDAENRGILSLPNLEFKLVAANSLIDLPLEVDHVLIGYIYKLADLRNEYFAQYGMGKTEIVKEYLEVRNELGKQAEIWHEKNQNIRKLVAWNPFSHDKSDWFDPKWMFGFEGFDIIIANPPYITEKGHKELFQPIKKGSLGIFYQGKMDIFYYFFHLAINIANRNGIVAFISTNYYITATFAHKLRTDFKKRSSIHKLVNFNELKIFESALGQHNIISILKKGQEDSYIANTIVTRRKAFATQDVLQTILYTLDSESDYYQVSNKDLFETNENYIRLVNDNNESNSLNSILNKIKEQGLSLEPNFARVNQGIVTGADKVSKKHYNNYELDASIGDGIFVLDLHEVSELNLNTHEQKLLKPFFKNSDIDRWLVNIKEQNLILFIGKDISEYELQNTLPSIYQHLLKFKDIMVDKRENLNERLDKWFTLNRGTSHPEIFVLPKIVAPQRSPRNTFGYNEIPWYASADVYYLTQIDKDKSLKYLLALLNSKLYYLWLYHKGKRKGEMLELYQKPLSEIPIKIIGKDEQTVFIKYVDEILERKSTNEHADISDLEAMINELVYGLYELTKEEIDIVEKFK